MIEHEREPIPGLPGLLPPGERILWQGSPQRLSLARTAFHTRLIAGYFALLAGYALISAILSGVRRPGDLLGVGMTAMVGATGVALLHLLAWGSARTTIYTLTNKRLVLRIGMALPKCINLPLGQIAAVGLGTKADGTGDLPMTLTGEPQLGYLALWPHARPWKLVRPQPMLRAVPDAAAVAEMIARHCLAANPGGGIALAERSAGPGPIFGEAAAA